MVDSETAAAADDSDFSDGLDVEDVEEPVDLDALADVTLAQQEVRLAGIIHLLYALIILVHM